MFSFSIFKKYMTAWLHAVYTRTMTGSNLFFDNEKHAIIGGDFCQHAHFTHFTLTVSSTVTDGHVSLSLQVMCGGHIAYSTHAISYSHVTPRRCCCVAPYSHTISGQCLCGGCMKIRAVEISCVWPIGKNTWANVPRTVCNSKVHSMDNMWKYKTCSLAVYIPVCVCDPIAYLSKSSNTSIDR